MRLILTGWLLALGAGYLGAQEPSAVVPDEERPAVIVEDGHDPKAAASNGDGISVDAQGLAIVPDQRPAVKTERGLEPGGADFMLGGVPVTAAGFIAPGTRVRVRSSEFPGWSYVGRIMEIDDESLLLELPDGVRPLRLKRTLVTKMEVSLGRHRRDQEGTKAGATVLGVLGAAAGAVLFAFGDAPAKGAIFGGLIGATTGAALGGFMGSGVTTESWRPVASSRISAAIGLRRGGGLGASLALRI